MGGRASVYTRKQMESYLIVLLGVRALARWVLHLREHNTVGKTLHSAFFHLGKCYDVSGNDISKGLKLAAQILQYPTTRGIPIERIDTHSLRSGGANVLALSGYSDTQIQ